MVFLILISLTAFFILISKLLFKSWFNHLSIYTFIWFILLTFYEMKLFYYYDLSLETWSIIVGSFLSFFLGIITYFSAKKSTTIDPNISNNVTASETVFFANNAKVLKITTIIFSMIGLAGAIQHWLVLIRNFGSIPNVILNANTIYQMRVEGELDFIPYLSLFSFVAVFLGSLYTARKGRISIYIVIPMIAVILSDLANFARSQMLFALIEFLCVMIFYKYSIVSRQLSEKKNSKLMFIGIVFVIVLLIGGATIVRSVRGTIESYSASTTTLNKLRGNTFITPSIYLYFSSDVGVLNKYLESDGEKTAFGENTFMPVYNILYKYGVVNKPANYQRGYFIPMWSNTGTYLRELHADFGITGVLLVPYSLGLLLTFLWFKYFETYSLNYLVLLVYFNILIFFSFLVMVTRLGYWIISLVIILFLLHYINKFAGLFIDKTNKPELEIE